MDNAEDVIVDGEEPPKPAMYFEDAALRVKTRSLYSSHGLIIPTLFFVKGTR